MSQDLLRRLAPLDPVEEEAVARDVREMWAEIDARVAAAPGPGAPRRWIANRRLQALVAACLAIALVALTLTAIRPDPTLPGSRTDDGWLVVGSLEDLHRAEVTFVQPARTFVVARPGEAPYAVSGISPLSPNGSDDALLYCRASETFEGPRFGEKFDREGGYLVGPSPSGMFGVPLRVVEDRVEIDPATLLPASPKSSGGPLEHTLCPPQAVWSEPGFVEVGGVGNSLLDMTFWHRAGDDVTVSTPVSTVPGTNCGFPVPAWLQLTDPLGSTPLPDDSTWRYYAADPEGVWADRSSSTYSRTEPLPETAEFSGYRSMLYELWIDPDTVGREVWVVRSDPNGGDGVERWPRVDLPQCDPFANDRG